MSITFLEAGTTGTYDLKAWDALAGPETSDSTIVHTGLRSMKLTAYGEARKLAVCGDAGRRISFYFYASALPSSTVDIAEVTSPVNGRQMAIGLQSSGIFRLRDGNGTVHAGTTAISAGTWYRLALSYTITTGVINEFRFYLAGALEVSVTNATTNVGSGSTSWFFELTLSAGLSVYFSDLYIDDTADLSDPGDIRVTAKLPASNNTNAWNTAIGANPANRWTNVNERPLSETNGWEETALAAVEESYGIEAAAAGDADLSSSTIVGHGAWIWAKGGAGGLGAPKLIRDGTDVAVTLTATAAYYAAYATSATYPSGVIGMKSAGVLDTTFLYEIGMLIAYTPGTVTYDFTFINPWMISA